MPYCGRCNITRSNLSQHQRDSPNHNICGDCDVDFSTYLALQSHWHESPNHEYCQDCDEYFNTKQEHKDHKRNEHSYCKSCNRVFIRGGARGLHDHNRQSHADRYCELCERIFVSGHHFQSHLQGSAHNDWDTFCPMQGCGKSFVSVAAMLLHLENGACTSGMDRSKVNQLAVAYDQSNIITNHSRLLMGASSSAFVTVTYSATDMAFNGDAWECYLCDREFRQKEDLDRHLNSPRHHEELYHCPRMDCGKEFMTLSGLMQHVESQACQAYRFRALRDLMNGLSNNTRRLTF